MRNKKRLTKAIIIGTLLSTSIGTLAYTNNTVKANALPVATTKGYNKLQKLSKQPGTIILKQGNGILALFLVIM